MNDAFVEAMRAGYALDVPSIVIGSPMHEGEVTNDTAQQRREMQRQARELKAAQQAAERQRREQASAGWLIEFSDRLDALTR